LPRCCSGARRARRVGLPADLDVIERVGTAVDVKHLAATPAGRDVRATAEVVKVEGRRIDFKVSAHDGTDEIGRGTHQRIVIDLQSFNERLARKSAT
jgi:fluoroacetyl-CoA thioesterase